MRALALIALVACGHLPHHAPGTGRPPSPADAMLDPVDDAAAFARADARLDRETDSVARPGNRVELLVDGVTSFTRRLVNAHDADVILVKTFTFTDDETGRAVATVLSERARAGAYVVLQYDVTGSIHGGDNVEEMIANDNELKIISGMRAAGVVIVPANSPAGPVRMREVAAVAERTVFHPIERIGKLVDWVHHLDFRDHEKYWITGHGGTLTAIMGGTNIGSEYGLGGSPHVDTITGARGWHDVDVEVTGPVVNDIVARFFDVMEDHQGKPRDPAMRARWNLPQREAGGARVRLVYNHPWFGNNHTIESLYAALIDAVPARGVVRIETAYFAPLPQVRHSLHAAIQRGTRVAVISNLDTNDSGLVAEGTWFAYHALLDLDPAVAVFARIARPDLGEVMVHCKVASFGTRGPVVIGSANLDGQSGEHNSEGVLVIDDPALRAQFDAMYDADHAPDRATRITRETFAHDSAWQEARRWAIWQLGWYWL